jgi:diguanylate cyclase (GGDEF)-like protein
MVQSFIRRQRTRYGPLVVASVLFAVLLGGGFYLADLGAKVQRNNRIDQLSQRFLTAMVDSETGVRGFVITGNDGFLEPYRDSMAEANEMLSQLLVLIPSRLGEHFDSAGLVRLVAKRQDTLLRTIDLRRDGGLRAAQQYVETGEGKLLMDEVRRQVSDIQAEVEQVNERLGSRLAFSLTVIVPLVGALTLLLLMMAFFQTRAMKRTLSAALAAEVEAERRGEQLEALSDMTDELHAAADREETYRIIRHHGARLLSGVSASLFVYNHSRDQLRLAAEWGDGASGTLRENFTPADCWGIRRGKPQLNSRDRSVQCAHVLGDDATLCVPITARGQTVGLLALSGSSLEAMDEEGGVRRIALTLCEQVALALVNLDLRERLENQALRDTLTNLYNRRYLEEASDRELNRAERLGTPLSLLAIDIDHFKRFNDQHGHAAGDEVLKRVCGHLADACRSTDLVCRLGGEELLVVLPDTDVEGAVAIGDKLRIEISRLRIRWHSGELPPVTISAGVATFPVHARKFSVLHSLADEALYAAKDAGRNQVQVWTATERESA